MRVIRTTFLLGALTLFLMLVGQYVGGRNGMTLGLGIAICTNAFAYFFSDKIALLSSGARPVLREELPRLYAVMERLAAKANLPVPKLYVIPEAAPNAFATGRNPRHASVAVTEGLLQLMNDDELEGVIAHELSHVRNYDILISSIAATIAGAITYLARMGYWANLFGYGGRDDDREGGGGVSFAARHLQAARIFRRCHRRAHGRPALRPYQRIAETRRLQQADSDDSGVSDHSGSLHRQADVRLGDSVVAVQHPSSLGGPHRGTTRNDRGAAALKPASAM